MRDSGPVRFGICGLGFMGRTYFAHLRNHPSARIVAVCDSDAGRRSGAWSDPVGNLHAQGGGQVSMDGIEAFDTPEALFQHPEVDAVAITLPTPTHAELSVAALQAGKHVLCEKPMALTLAECDRMIDADSRSPQILMVAQCIRFWPQYEMIHGLVTEGAIGAVRFATLRRLASPPAYSSGNWLMDSTRSGGALLDLHIHDVDFAHHLLGIPTSLLARGLRGPSGGIDHVVASYAYRDGRYATLEGGWVFHGPWPFEMSITVQGDRGTLHWNSNSGPDLLHFRDENQPRRIDCGPGTGWIREIDYFVECVRRSQAVERCTPESARVSIALALEERRSIEQSSAVVVAGLA